MEHENQPKRSKLEATLVQLIVCRNCLLDQTNNGSNNNYNNNNSYGEEEGEEEWSQNNK